MLLGTTTSSATSAFKSTFEKPLSSPTRNISGLRAPRVGRPESGTLRPSTASCMRPGE
jgi:hypothetical protein